MRPPVLALPIAAALLLAAPASAHHSYAMFDRGKTLTLTGYVKEFDMVAPHGWLKVVVLSGAEPAKVWSLEMGPPGILARQGWTAQSVQAGDAVSVRLHPMRDGSFGGQLISVKLASGKTLAGGPLPGASRGGGEEF